MGFAFVGYGDDCAAVHRQLRGIRTNGNFRRRRLSPDQLQKFFYVIGGRFVHTMNEYYKIYI